MSDRHPIPNINIGQVYDQRYSDSEVHYDRLGNLAGFSGATCRCTGMTDFSRCIT